MIPGANDQPSSSATTRRTLAAALAQRPDVVATHDPRLAERADRVVAMEAGRVVADSALPGPDIAIERSAFTVVMGPPG